MVGALLGKTRLEIAAWAGNNSGMQIHGHIRNGVVVFEGNPNLPEGAAVTVLIPTPAPPVAPPVPETELVCEPGKLPYVRGGIPGTWNLTNEMIAQILEEEDLQMMKGMGNVPS
jgi:hypothetical protein